MIITYPTFLFILNLGAVMLIAFPLFHFAPTQTLRDIVVGTTGAILTFYIAPRLLIFFVVYWTVVWLCSRWVADRVEAEEEPDSFALLTVCAVLLVPLLFWRLNEPLFLSVTSLYLNDLIGFFSTSVQGVDRSATLLPVGLSFATFRAIDLVVQTYLGAERKLRASEMYSFAFFPSVLVIGPIIQRREVAEHKTISNRKFDLSDYWVALTLMAVGLFKVFALSATLDQFGAVVASPASYNPIEVFLMMALYYVSFYLNFAGYSDLAIGFGRLLGFRLQPNFASPLTKTSPQEFWNSWHMSLSRFAQRNVYVPLGGFRPETRRLATAMTMLTIALWHGIGIGLLIFGVYHTAGLLLWPKTPSEPTPAQKGLRMAATFLFVLLSMPFVWSDLPGAIDMYRALIGV